MEIRTDLFLGDSKNILKNLADNSVDLIITSLDGLTSNSNERG